MARNKLFLIVSFFLLPVPSFAGITYHTIDVSAAIAHGGNQIDGFIRGNATDTDLTFLLPADRANPAGALSTYFMDLSPVTGVANSFLWNYQSGTAVWDDFYVTGNTVQVRDVVLDLNEIRTDGFVNHQTLHSGTPFNLTVDLNGTGTLNYTANFEVLAAPFPGFVGNNTQLDVVAHAAYVLNDPATGLQTATASQFPVLGALGANYLNGVVADHLSTIPWTQAGIWLFSGQYTSANTRGDDAHLLIGGNYIGYNVWYSTDTFVFGQPLSDSDGDGLFSNAEVEALVTNGEFPEVAGLNLAGDGFAQLYDVAVVEGDGTVQTLIFEYDETVLAPGEEDLLEILHFTGGEWVKHNQILDTIANTITVEVSSFSPFALVAVPLPPAVWLLGSAVLGLLVSSKRKIIC